MVFTSKATWHWEYLTGSIAGSRSLETSRSSPCKRTEPNGPRLGAEPRGLETSHT